MSKEKLQDEIIRVHTLIPSKPVMGAALLSRLLEQANLAANSDDSGRIQLHLKTLEGIQ